jgi:hypothetical protein
VTKRQDHFAKIAEFKARFAKLPAATREDAWNLCSLQKKAAIAIRQLLEEQD